ncbi:MAG TPA: hypothetical protein VNA25_19565 [Phycisphaerae bacterium]|nr:hypothetical protein [Phycisphaerae bacterium]
MARIDEVMDTIAKRQMLDRPEAAMAAQAQRKAREDVELAARPKTPFEDGDPRCLEKPSAELYAIRPGILSCVVPDGHECDGFSHRMPKWSTVHAKYNWTTYRLCPTYSEEKTAAIDKKDEIVETQKTRSRWRAK